MQCHNCLYVTGPVVDEPALVNALQTGQIAGAVMDVTTLEPCEPVRRPLRDMCVARTGALETETE